MTAPIFKLPDEILLHIAEDVKNSGAIPWYDVMPDSMSRSHIVNLSMTCRRFREVTGHLLLPMVKVNFSYSSLDRLEEISRHPTIRKGIRNVRVELTYFNRELCENFNKFVEFYARELDEYLGPDRRPSSNPGAGVGGGDLFTLVKRRPDINQARSVLESWIGIRRHQPGGDPHRKLLEEAHATYKHFYAEQEKLLQTGEFCNRVAEAVARMPIFERLIFWDRTGDQTVGDEQWLSGPWNFPVRAGVDVRDAYYGVMRLGMSGRDAWAHEGFRLAQSNLYMTLIHLPIALHRAGVVSCPSLDIRLDGLQNDQILESDDETLARLSSAVRSLSIRNIEFLGTPIINMGDADQMAGEAKVLSVYLAYLLNSPKLEYVTLDICGIENPYCDYYYPDCNWTRLPAGSCFSSFTHLANPSSNLKFKLLTNLDLFRVSFRRRELVSFLEDGLPNAMEQLSLVDVELVEGGKWEDVLDCLRAKTYSNREFLKLQNLFGGERDSMGFEERDVFFGYSQVGSNNVFGGSSGRRRRRSSSSSSSSSSGGSSGSSRTTLLEKYCLRRKRTNPLRAFREGRWDLGLYLAEEPEEGERESGEERKGKDMGQDDEMVE